MMHLRPKLYRTAAMFVLCGAIVSGSYAIARRLSGPPRVVVAPSTYDFGVVSGGTEVQHTFTIQNQGYRPLVIRQLGISCGCIKKASMLGNSIIPAGQSQKLLVTWETPTYASVSSQAVTLYTNDPTAPTKYVTLRATSQPKFVIEPNVVNYGIVEVADLPITQQLVVEKNLLQKDDRLSVTTQSQQVKLATTTKDAGQQWVTSVTLPKGTPLGVISGSVDVHTKWGKPQRVAILGQVVGDIRVEPDEMYVRASTPATTIMQNIVVRSRRGTVQSVRVIGISTSLRDILSKMQNQVFQSSDIKVPIALSPAKKAVRIKGSILLHVLLASGEAEDLGVPIMIDRY